MTTQARIDAVRYCYAHGIPTWNLLPLGARFPAPSRAWLGEVALWHDAAIHAPEAVPVRTAYTSLRSETLAQAAMIRAKVEPWTAAGQPYANSDAMRDDVARGHLWYFPTGAGFGDGTPIVHPMLEAVPEDGRGFQCLNDVFRAVHDFYGHGQHAFGFGPGGEYWAFQEHARLYTSRALPALAAETLAQNAWVNFGPHLKRADGTYPRKWERDYVPLAERPYAEQKAYAFPLEVLARDPLYTGNM